MSDVATLRRDALAWADAARATRLRLREELSCAAVTLPEVLAAAETDPLVAAVRLQWVLESLPGAGKSATRRVMSAHLLDGDLPLGSLDEAERARVLDLFDPARSAQ